MRKSSRFSPGKLLIHSPSLNRYAFVSVIGRDRLVFSTASQNFRLISSVVVKPSPRSIVPSALIVNNRFPESLNVKVDSDISFSFVSVNPILSLSLPLAIHRNALISEPVHDGVSRRSPAEKHVRDVLGGNAIAVGPRSLRTGACASQTQFLENLGFGQESHESALALSADKRNQYLFRCTSVPLRRQSDTDGLEPTAFDRLADLILG